jgi:hypothetical protein
VRLRATVLGAGVVAATMATGGQAMAAPLCFGTADTVVQCVDPTGATLIDDCVYLGPPPCHTVIVNGPLVYCASGRIGDKLVCIW